MPGKRITRLILIFLIVAGSIGCDQVSKKMVRHSVTPYETIAVIGQHLTVTNVENSGAFLSLGNSLSSSLRSVLLSVIPLLLLGGALIYIIYKKNISLFPLLGFCFIIGGGFGNIYDRIAYGSVTDFLHIQFGIFQTGIFNLADVSIVTGTVIIFINSIQRNRAAKPKEGQVADIV